MSTSRTRERARHRIWDRCSRSRRRQRRPLCEKLDDRDLLTSFHEAAGVGDVGAGADLAYVDLDKNGLDDVIAMAYSEEDGPNRFRYRIGYDVDARGVPAHWSPVRTGPSLGTLGQGAGLAVTDLDGDSRPEIVLMAYDNPAGANSFRYVVGFDMDASGFVASWGPRQQVLGVGWEGAGAGLTIGNLDGDPRPDAIFMAYDDPAGANTFRLRIAYNLNASGVPQSVGGIIRVGGVGHSADGAGIALGDLDADQRPDLVLMAYDNSARANTFRVKIGYNITAAGQADWSSAPIEVAGRGWEGEGAGIALRDIDHDGMDEFTLMAYDAPGGPNAFRFIVHEADTTVQLIGSQLVLNVGLRGGLTAVSPVLNGRLYVTTTNLRGVAQYRSFPGDRVTSIRINGSEAADVIRIGDIPNREAFLLDGRFMPFVSDGQPIPDCTICGNGLDDHIRAAEGDDLLDGGSGNDVLEGVAGDDTIIGAGGDDKLDGGDGYNRFVFSGGRLGHDTITRTAYGDSSKNTIDLSRFDGAVRLDLESSALQVVHPDHLKLTLDTAQAIDDIFGSRFDDVLYGNLRDNVIHGLAGNDTLYGGGGDDSLWGDSGNDMLYGQMDDDRLFGGDGIDYLFGGTGDDGLYGGSDTDFDFLSGGSLGDRFLTRTRDVKIDFSGADVEIQFVDGSSTWTELEIETMDRAFRQLQRAVGSTVILTKADGPMKFEKVAADDPLYQIPQLQSLLFHYSPATPVADWNENSAQENRLIRSLVIHAVAHNWDSDDRNPIWSTFEYYASGWDDPREYWASLWQEYFGYVDLSGYYWATTDRIPQFFAYLRAKYVGGQGIAYLPGDNGTA